MDHAAAPAQASRGMGPMQDSWRYPDPAVSLGFSAAQNIFTALDSFCCKNPGRWTLSPPSSCSDIAPDLWGTDSAGLPLEWARGWASPPDRSMICLWEGCVKYRSRSEVRGPAYSRGRDGFYPLLTHRLSVASDVLPFLTATGIHLHLHWSQALSGQRAGAESIACCKDGSPGKAAWQLRV